MKKITAIVLVLLISAIATACSVDGGNISSDENGVSLSSETDLLTGSQGVSENISNGADENGDGFGEESQEIFFGFEEFHQATTNYYKNNILDANRLSSVLDIASIVPHKDYYSYGTRNGSVHIYPTIDESKKTKEPWLYYTERWGISSIKIYSDTDERNNSTEFLSKYGVNAYKFTKEGIDVYLVEDPGVNGNYVLCFRIGEYSFIVSSATTYKLHNGEFISSDTLKKLEKDYGKNASFLEITDVTHENSELIRVLKDIVAAKESESKE